mmetsp:Transcript_87266/g.281947  ORF Transcript_87266/g.281947 Transcript_87266/m.281947 type:complete len:157 (+) Transcript_87266:334-804(+)
MASKQQRRQQFRTGPSRPPKAPRKRRPILVVVDIDRDRGERGKHGLRNFLRHLRYLDDDALPARRCSPAAGAAARRGGSLSHGEEPVQLPLRLAAVAAAAAAVAQCSCTKGTRLAKLKAIQSVECTQTSMKMSKATRPALLRDSPTPWPCTSILAE